MSVKIVLFCHSLRSDWNHGNAHFLRGVAAELMRRGHEVRVYEPQGGWSLTNLIASHGPEAAREFERFYPGLTSELYDPASFEPDGLLGDTRLVIVHEWNDPRVVNRIGAHRRAHGRYLLFFHDTHHRSVTDPEAMSRYDLSGYDGVLAFGEAVSRIYRREGWAGRVWTWHEAADTRVFRPVRSEAEQGDLVWVGNWGDGERTEEIREFILEPVRRLSLRAKLYGVRYPDDALAELARRGIAYGGRIANCRVPEIFSAYRVTLHVPRRPYAEALPGIPTIRVFEALACGIPLISAPWEDREGLFTPGADYLVARDGAEMTRHLDRLVHSPEERAALAGHGRRTIEARHTCAHRVDELFGICRACGLEPAPACS